MNPCLYRNRLKALRQRLFDIGKFDLSYDDDLSGINAQDIEYVDIKLVCESIGIDKTSDFCDMIHEQYDEIIDELSDSLRGKSISSMILDGYFGISSLYSFAPRYKLLQRVEKLAFKICKKHNIDMTEDTLMLILDSNEKSPILTFTKNYKPYTLKLDTLLYRALIIPEAIYELIEWINIEIKKLNKKIN